MNKSGIMIIGILSILMFIVAISGCASNTTNNTAQPTKITQATGIPLSEVPNLAQQITESGVSFNTLNFKGVDLDRNQCLYITARAIVMLNKGETGNIPINKYGNPENPYGYITTATIAKVNYVDMAQRTYTSWIRKRAFTQLCGYIHSWRT